MYFNIIIYNGLFFYSSFKDFHIFFFKDANFELAIIRTTFSFRPGKFYYLTRIVISSFFLNQQFYSN